MSLSNMDEKPPKNASGWYGHDIAINSVTFDTGEPLQKPQPQASFSSDAPKANTIQSPEQVHNGKYCSCCGSPIDGSTKQCTGCGKQYFRFPKKVSSLFFAAAIILALLFGFFGYSYSKGIDAMNNQQFIVAQQYFDNLIIGEKLFPDKYAYISAGVLMEEGKYTQAFNAFNSLEGTPVPVSITDSLKAKIYSAGQSAYRAGDMSEAKANFFAIEGYKRTDDYGFLMDCREGKFSLRLDRLNGTDKSYKALMELIGFEDTTDIILNDPDLLKHFLLGRWENEASNNPYYFELHEDDDGSGYSSRYNLPSPDAEGYFHLDNGIYSVGETSSKATKYYRFSIINEDTISVYCYEDGSTHELHCVKRYEPMANAKNSDFYAALEDIFPGYTAK